MQRGFLVGRKMIPAWRKSSFGKTRAGFSRGPSPGIMQPDVPSSGAAHGESAQHDAVGINIVSLPHRFQGFEDIGLSSPAVSVVGGAEDFHLDKILIWRNGLRAVMRGDEAHLVERGTNAMPDQVEPNGWP